GQDHREEDTRPAEHRSRYAPMPEIDPIGSDAFASDSNVATRLSSNELALEPECNHRHQHERDAKRHSSRDIRKHDYGGVALRGDEGHANRNRKNKWRCEHGNRRRDREGDTCQYGWQDASQGDLE